MSDLFSESKMMRLFNPYASKHLVRRYLDPKNIPKTPSQEVSGRLGMSKEAAGLSSYSRNS